MHALILQLCSERTLQMICCHGTGSEGLCCHLSTCCQAASAGADGQAEQAMVELGDG